jgi:hypothetical protein
MDAMSHAIEGADVMLYGVSLRYKESANVSHSGHYSLSVVAHADTDTDTALHLNLVSLHRTV